MNKVAIIVPTMNRADFAVRLLNYYSSLNSPHAIYFADSSNTAQSQILKQKISELKGKLDVHYNYYPAGDTIKCFIELLKQVKEKYSCYIGDDDYFVPRSLTACAQFLEVNPDFSTAIGISLTFKIHGNGAYGKLKEIHDYPRRSITAHTASQRLFDYWGPALTPLINCVSKTNDMLHAFEIANSIQDILFRGDYLPSTFLIISGKSKVLEQVGFVRQIHDNHFAVPDTYDWVTGRNWQQAFEQFKNITADLLLRTDNINRAEAELNFKRAFWRYFGTYMPKFYNDFLNSFRSSKPVPIKLRHELAKAFPFLKRFYRLIKFKLDGKIQFHYEVTRSESPYYEDFQAVLKTFTKPIDTF